MLLQNERKKINRMVTFILVVLTYLSITYMRLSGPMLEDPPHGFYLLGVLFEKCYLSFKDSSVIGFQMFPLGANLPLVVLKLVLSPCQW